MKDEMTSMERVLVAMTHKEPDRVPLFLMLTMHGARLLDVPLEKYLTSSESIVKAQLRLQKMFQNDVLYPLGYAAAEVEAFGGEVLFFDDGPPNSGRPIIQDSNDIESLEPPDASEAKPLKEMLKTISMMKKAVGSDVPIIGVVVSPFSLPIMQMGFDRYLDLLYSDEEHFWELMEVNERFCLEWGRLQLEAGATALGYFDPVSSPTILPREMYLRTGFKVAKRTIAKFKGPVATHLASGRCLDIVDDLAVTGTAGIGVSALEEIGMVKQSVRGRMTIIGNLNGIEMVRWTKAMTEKTVKETIQRAGRGGGFVLSDNHGEIPYQVSFETLEWIADAARRHGKYPFS